MVQLVTLLVFGYVQSGKTLSFTMLSTLAIDNGYRVIVYLAGTKNNLVTQTKNRLIEDLSTKGSTHYKILGSLILVATVAYTMLSVVCAKPAILIPIIKRA